MNDMTAVVPELASPDYEEDAVAWLENQIGLLRARKFDQLDIGNLLEELESIVRNERHELKSRLEVLILHLLKCQFQPSKRSGSWMGTINEQRSRLEDLLEDSPSLRRLIPEWVDALYARAARHAASETGLPRATFPESLPYTIAQLLDDNFLP